eukprot:TRINITY_DN22945_c0_g1_i1.p1 TRINITY_DN22945_c0_g1~~TRINITY_DN22945_c0_g1_i1.p1  ORF type:complete len:273 (-),score=84.40 TRINITY_DN22945_c0_g1_i1:80-898(-)
MQEDTNNKENEEEQNHNTSEDHQMPDIVEPSSSMDFSYSSPPPLSLSSSSTSSPSKINVEYLLLIEYKYLLKQKYPISGIYVLPSFDSLYVWHGVIFLRSGYYASAVFRFKITFPPSYPETPPTLSFTTPIYHPLISPDDGSVDISREFPNWQPSSHSAAAVLAFIKRIFYQLDKYTEKDKAILNPQALQAYLNHRKEFVTLTAECVRKSCSSDVLFDNPSDSSLKFSPFTKEHEEVKESIMKGQGTQPKDVIISLVSKGISGLSKVLSYKY